MTDETRVRTSPAYADLILTTSTRSAAAGPARLLDAWTLSLLERGDEHLWRHGALSRVRTGDVSIYAPGEVESVLQRLAPPSRRIDLAFHTPAQRERPAVTPLRTASQAELAHAVALVAHGLATDTRGREHEDALVRLDAAFAARPSPLGPRPEPACVARVREHLEAHSSLRLRLHDLAALGGVSEGHLVRTFHAWVGVPPHAYLQLLRVAEARRMLADGLPCAVVALRAGFADSSHLTRLFRRLLGYTPSQYAETQRAARTSRPPPPRPARPALLTA
jgi:AraC-like DNA-binding protein